MNGTEVHRENIAKGQALADGPACGERHPRGPCRSARAVRKGVNVIGLEIIRTPYPEQTQNNVYEENSCQILSVKLTCGSPAGLVPNAVRPRDFQIWNADPLAADFDLDFGDQAEPLRPVIIAGARNGSFTGKIVAGSARPIRNLQVTAAELRGPGGIFPPPTSASAMAFRGVSTARSTPAIASFPRPIPLPPSSLGALAEKPLAEFPVLADATDDYWPAFRPDATEIKPVRGAMVPLMDLRQGSAGRPRREVLWKRESGGRGRKSHRSSPRSPRCRLVAARHPGLPHLGGHDRVSGHAGPGIQGAAVVGQALGTDRGVLQTHGRGGRADDVRPADRAHQPGQRAVDGPLGAEGRQVRLRLLGPGPVLRCGREEHGQAQAGDLRRLGRLHDSLLRHHERGQETARGRKKSPSTCRRRRARWAADRWSQCWTRRRERPNW